MHKMHAKFGQINHSIKSMLEKDLTPRQMAIIMGLIVILLSSLVFLRDIDHPKQAFWDESYYVTAAERMVRDQHQYASHPPLGFMLMDIGISVTGSNKNIDTSSLSGVKKLNETHKLPKNYDFLGIRIMAGLFSVLGAYLFFLILNHILNQPFEAFLFSLLFIFENAFVVHFRGAHLDPYQMGFILAALYLFFKGFGAIPKKPLLHAASLGGLVGLGFMVKTNALLFLALGLIILARRLWDERTWTGLRHCLTQGLTILGGFFFVVGLIFTLQGTSNPHPLPIGSEARNSYERTMGAQTKSYLDGKTPLSPEVIWDSTKGYIAYMKNDYTGIIAHEANGSETWRWPFMHRIINYRWDHDGQRTAYVQMVGNPINWAIGFIASLAALVLILWRRLSIVPPLMTALSRQPILGKWMSYGRSFNVQDMNRLEAVMTMYLIYWGIHIYIGTQRVMYIYHYFLALILVFFMSALVFKILFDRFENLKAFRFNTALVMALLIGAGFIFYSPLTFHKPLTREQCELRNIPFTAVICQPKAKSNH